MSREPLLAVVACEFVPVTFAYAGSGRSFQAYVFSKASPTSLAQFMPGQVQQAVAEPIAVQEAEQSEQASTSTVLATHTAALVELPQHTVGSPSKASRKVTSSGSGRRQTVMREFAQERKSVVLDSVRSKSGSVSKASGSPSKAEGRTRSSRLAAKAAAGVR